MQLQSDRNYANASSGTDRQQQPAAGTAALSSNGGGAESGRVGVVEASMRDPPPATIWVGNRPRLRVTRQVLALLLGPVIACQGLCPDSGIPVHLVVDEQQQQVKERGSSVSAARGTATIIGALICFKRWRTTRKGYQYKTFNWFIRGVLGPLRQLHDAIPTDRLLLSPVVEAAAPGEEGGPRVTAIRAQLLRSQQSPSAAVRAAAATASPVDEAAELNGSEKEDHRGDSRGAGHEGGQEDGPGMEEDSPVGEVVANQPRQGNGKQSAQAVTGMKGAGEEGLAQMAPGQAGAGGAGQPPQSIEGLATGRAAPRSRHKCADRPPQRRHKTNPGDVQHDDVAAVAVATAIAPYTLADPGPITACGVPVIGTNPGAMATGGSCAPRQQLLPRVEAQQVGGQDLAVAVGRSAAEPQQGQQVMGAIPRGYHTQQQQHQPDMQSSRSVPRIQVRLKREVVVGPPAGPAATLSGQDDRAAGPTIHQHAAAIAQPNTTGVLAVGEAGHPLPSPTQHQQPLHVAAPIQDSAAAGGGLRVPTIKPDPDVMDLVSDDEDAAPHSTQNLRDHHLHSNAGVMQPRMAPANANTLSAGAAALLPTAQGPMPQGHWSATAFTVEEPTWLHQESKRRRLTPRPHSAASGMLAALPGDSGTGSGAPLAPLTGKKDQPAEMMSEILSFAGQQLDDEAAGELRSALFELQFVQKDDQRIKALYYTMCHTRDCKEVCRYLERVICQVLEKHY